MVRMFSGTRIRFGAKVATPLAIAGALAGGCGNESIDDELIPGLEEKSCSVEVANGNSLPEEGPSKPVKIQACVGISMSEDGKTVTAHGRVFATTEWVLGKDFFGDDVKEEHNPRAQIKALEFVNETRGGESAAWVTDFKTVVDTEALNVECGSTYRADMVVNPSHAADIEISVELATDRCNGMGATDTQPITRDGWGF
jgi:hypothetical protein